MIFKDKTSLYEFIFFGILLAVLLSMSLRWGPSTDELHQQPYGKASYEFYKTFGAEDDLTKYATDKNVDELMIYYGAIIDTLPEMLQDIFGGDLYTYRHLVITFFSFLLLVFGYKTGKYFGDWRYGLVTLAIILVLPRIMGEFFNNPKDVPFAGAYIMGLYYIIRFIDQYPKIKNIDILKISLAIGLTMAIRIGGLLLFFYLGLFLAIKIFTDKELREETLKSSKNIQKVFINLGLVFIVTYIIMVILWPAALMNPIEVPYEAYNVFSKFPVSTRTLFEGNWIMSDTVPGKYITRYFFNSNPEVVFVGLGLLIFTFRKFSKYQKMYLGLLAFSSIFPIMIIVLKGSSLYNGWRQEYFTFIPLAIISGVSWSKLFFENYKKVYKYVAIAVFAVLMYLPLSFMIRNYPQFYVYFNNVSGGMEKNYGLYEMDYYGHSVNEATHWIQKNHPEWFTDTNIKVVSNVSFNMQKMLDKQGITKQIGYARYRERYENDWDIAIFSPAFVDPSIIKNNLFKSVDVVHSIDIDGKPIGVIIQRTNKDDLEGLKYIKENKFPEAINSLTKAITYNPYNEIAWANLALAQLQSGQAKLAAESATKAKSISPESAMANNVLGYAYLNTGDVNSAQYVFLDMINQNPNNPEPYRILAQIYQQQGNYQAAQQYNNYYQQLTTAMQSK